MHGIIYDPETIRRIKKSNNEKAKKKIEEAFEAAKKGDYEKATKDIKEAILLYVQADTIVF